MIRFNTKTQLKTHIQELVDLGYLVANPIQIKQSRSSIYIIDTFTINYHQIKEDRMKKV